MLGRMRPGNRRGRHRRIGAAKRAVLAAGVGLMLIAAFALQACRSPAPGDFGAAETGATPSGTLGPSADAGNRPEPGSPARAGAPREDSVAIRDGRLQSAAGIDAPARLRIPAAQIDASVDAVGIDPATGELAVPPRVDRVGWYEYGSGFSAPTGSIVIAGHVDSAAEGKGAFSRLGSLSPGDVITLADTRGRLRDFAVVARETYPKTKIPLARYFARDGNPRLTLITCGGPFDKATRHYRDNVVVTATPKP